MASFLVICIVDLVFGLLMAVLIRYRRRHPLAIALILQVLGAVSFSGFGFLSWAVVSLATRRRWRPVGLVVALGTALSVAATMLLPRDGVFGPSDQGMIDIVITGVVTLVWGLLLAVLGFYIGARRDLVASLRERAETNEQAQALRIEQGRADERARIAREMHDVVAHRLSLVSMHAGVLAFRQDLSPEQTSDIAHTIQENSHAALEELRAVLSDLRSGGQPAAPQPTLVDLPELVEMARSLGSDVRLTNEVKDQEQIPTSISRHAYRIIQESLTNARKHAAGAPVYVNLWGRHGDGVHIEVRNPLAVAAAVPGAGLGLVGLKERAGLAGGTLRAERRHGDFVVTAWLPWLT